MREVLDLLKLEEERVKKCIEHLERKKECCGSEIEKELMRREIFVRMGVLQGLSESKKLVQKVRCFVGWTESD